MDLRLMKSELPSDPTTTPLPMKKPPPDIQARFYSGKYKEHCLGVMACVSHDGRICYVAPPQPIGQELCMMLLAWMQSMRPFCHACGQASYGWETRVSSVARPLFSQSSDQQDIAC